LAAGDWKEKSKHARPSSGCGRSDDINLVIARGAYREAARMYSDELIELRQGARVIERSR
jgi:hypothetical protein